MKKYLALLSFIFLISFVSAYDSCVGDWCCDDSGYVICNPLGSPFICGKDAGWCDNYNNPSLSCIPGEDWCCYVSGHVADYSAHLCCPPDSPFYITSGIYSGYCGEYNTGGANNYYTNLATCDYLYSWDTAKFTIEETCSNYDFKVCERNGISKWINGWDNRGAVINECGVTCLTDSSCPSDEVLNNFCNINQIMKTTRQYSCSNYNCISTDKTEVVQTCSLNCDDSSGVPICVGCTDNDIILLDDIYYICRNNNLEPVLDLVEFSDAEQQALLDQIHLLDLSVEEQLAIVANLELTLEEKKLLAANLQLELDEQILLVEATQSTLDEQIAIAESLNLNITAQGIMIEELTDNLNEKLYWLEQLEITTEEQGILLEEMRLNFADQAFILDNLNNTVQEDIIIINNLNLNLQDTKKLLSELQRTNDEMAELIASMDLSLEESAVIIAGLRLTLEEEQLMVSQLTDKINEQNAMLEILKRENRPTLENLWNNYRFYILLVSLIVLVIIISLIALLVIKK